MRNPLDDIYYAKQELMAAREEYNTNLKKTLQALRQARQFVDAAILEVEEQLWALNRSVQLIVQLKSEIDKAEL